MKQSDNKKGFTVLEIMLVLGLAGLIFMMVFIALPALQRNSTDAIRRDDIAIFLGAVKHYQSNNRGALPSNWKNDLEGYLSNDFADPDGNKYNFKEIACKPASGSNICKGGSNELVGLEDKNFPNNHNLYIIKGASCDGDTAIKSSNTRKIAVVYKLQGVGVYCNHT